MTNLEELVNLLSTAIEYYESNDDQKYKGYQMRLCVLLSKPEIIKQMKIEKEKNLKQEKKPEIEENDTNIDYKKDQERKQLKMKVNYISQLSNMANQDNQVKNILDEMSKPVETKEVLFNKELNQQENSFKQRLEEKKTKKASY